MDHGQVGNWGGKDREADAREPSRSPWGEWGWLREGPLPESAGSGDPRVRIPAQRSVQPPGSRISAPPRLMGFVPKMRVYASDLPPLRR